MKRVSIILSALCAVLLLDSCTSQPQFAEGIEPAPRTGFVGRRKQLPLPAEKADVALVFVGGFTEQVLLHFRTVYEKMPLLPCKGRQLRAYYAWDSGTGNLLFHSTWKLQRDLRAFMAVNPQADVVLVATIDPVSCRERSKPRDRAPQVDYWVNSYCSPYRNVRDVAAMVGGPWGNCPQADDNLCYSGKERDADGDRFAHVYPEPMFMEPAPGTDKSTHHHLVEACKRLKIGRKD